MIFKRGVEGDQQTREDIDEMSKTQEAETKEQMNRVPATLEIVAQKPVRKADNHNCKAATETFLTFAVLISAARVIDVEFVKQVVNSLSAAHSEPKTLDTGGARTIHIDYLERNCIERCMMKLENDDRGDFGWRAVACVCGHWSDIGEDLIVVHSWTMGVVLLVTVGVGLLSCACAVFDPHLPTGNVHVTREPEVA